MINIVTIANKKYLVDVGFGGSGAPTHPVSLISDQPSPNVGSQRIRLLFSNIADNTNKDRKCGAISSAILKTGRGSMVILSPRRNFCRKIFR